MQISSLNIFIVYCLENGFGHFMQTISIANNLYEMLSGKKKKYIGVCRTLCTKPYACPKRFTSILSLRKLYHIVLNSNDLTLCSFLFVIQHQDFGFIEICY